MMASQLNFPASTLVVAKLHLAGGIVNSPSRASERF
jgi:hypothetical protein